MTADIVDGAVVKAVDLDRLLAQREVIVEQAEVLRLAGMKISDIMESTRPSHERTMCNVVVATSYTSRYSPTHDITRPEAARELLRKFDAMAWQEMLSSSGMGSLMDRTALERWHASLEAGTAPPFTRDNVASTFTELHANRDAIVGDGVERMFRERSWSHKTNEPNRLTTTMIFSHGVQVLFSGALHLDYGAARSIDDVLRVMAVVKRVPLPADHVPSHVEIQRARWVGIDANGRMHGVSQGAGDAVVEVKGFKSRTLHMRILDEATVEQMNRIMAKRYPAALGF